MGNKQKWEMAHKYKWKIKNGIWEMNNNGKWMKNGITEGKTKNKPCLLACRIYPQFQSLDKLRYMSWASPESNNKSWRMSCTASYLFHTFVYSVSPYQSSELFQVFLMKLKPTKNNKHQAASLADLSIKYDNLHNVIT